MSRVYSVLGNVTYDYHCRAAFHFNDNYVDFHQMRPPFRLETCRPVFVGGKLTLKTPLTDVDMERLGCSVAPGGGGLGTVKGLMENISSTIQYLDVSKPEETFLRCFGDIAVDCTFLALRSAPFNLVLGCRSNKIILKNAVHPVDISPTTYQSVVRRLAGSEWIILNSVKDGALMHAAAEAALTTSRCKIAVILTTSLPSRFVRQHILPVTHVLIVSFDELQWLLPGRQTDMTSSRERLLRLVQESRPNASLFVTLGRRGVLCASQAGFFHVRLKDEVARQVGDVVNRCPLALSGAGDYFSGGVIANRSIHAWSSQPEYPQIVQDAVAGSITAIKHLGYQVGSEDFIVREDVWSESSYAASPREMPSRSQSIPGEE